MFEKKVYLHQPFIPEEAAYIKEKGKNTIAGAAFLRTRGGEVRTCAGYDVLLIPVTAYSLEKMEKMYGSTHSGYLTTHVSIANDSREYYQYMRGTSCDQRGDFVFRNVADGEYFVISSVLWETFEYYYNRYEATTQGGYMMRRIEVSGGEVAEVILTR